MHLTGLKKKKKVPFHVWFYFWNLQKAGFGNQAIQVD